MNVLISASSESRPEWRTIPSWTTAVYRAHEEIELRDGFTVEWGADFTAEIVPCANCGLAAAAVAATATGDSLPLTAKGPAAPPEAEAEGGQPLPAMLYPNPTSGELTVAVEGGEVQSIVVYGRQGQPVGGWRLVSLGVGRATLDVGPLPSGAYLLLVRTADGGLQTGRFLRQ